MEPQTFLNNPAMIAPPGEHYNFLNPPNRNTASQGVIVSCLILSVLAVGMRMWTKTRVVRKVVWEDCKSTSHFSESPLELYGIR